MLLKSTAHSVSQRARYQAGIMLQILGESMFTNDQERNCSNVTKQFEKTPEISSINKNIVEEYEKTIEALNLLQSNAAEIRRSIETNAKKTRLKDVVKYLQRSGLDEEDLRKLSVIHVSGTKGKGSTCALTESILRAHGFKTGFFSSPHLCSVTERIRLNGLPITKLRFTQVFWRILKSLQKSCEHPADMPGYFQFLMILSFHIFLEEKVDVTVLEVGIGGELDSTNIISHTKTVGITSLGLEHTQLLGNTLEDIAWQKAGIIKPNSNVFTSVKQPECLAVIRQRAEEKNAQVFVVPDFSYYEDIENKNGNSGNMQSCNNIIQLNGSLAIQLAHDWLRNNTKNGCHSSLKPIKYLSENFVKGLYKCCWPGRCQMVRFGNMKIHLDGAHTVESMEVCSNWFESVTSSSENPKVLIFNTTGDRNVRKLLEILRQRNEFQLACFVPNFASSHLTHSDNISICGISSQMARTRANLRHWEMLCQDEDITRIDDGSCGCVFGSVLDSLNFLKEKFGDQREVDVLVTGSLHLIGATVFALDEFKPS